MTELSCVIPVFNNEIGITVTISRLSEFLEHRTCDFEIIVVDDGSTDATLSVLHHLAELNPHLRVIQSTFNQGKGAAVRQGILASNGRYVFFTDDDLNVVAESMARCLDAVLVDGFDIAIGNRRSTQSQALGSATRSRKIGSDIFNTFARIVLLPNIDDTQCSMKVFTQEAARSLFRVQIVKSYAFDVEILYKAHLQALKVQQVPVTWHDKRARVNLRKLLKLLGLAMFDVVRVKAYYCFIKKRG